ncbi:MAG: SpoIIE family protein phosphatase [Bacteroidetes bacterium]|nr:SpoIIE family protein phosphatase [Bacteroidota bacterium]MBU1717948.1 SpoIIE family protein phosphatase [Bacteroidota bacterium]
MSNVQERAELLAQVSIFSETKKENLERIANLFQFVVIEEDEVLFHKGDPGDSMYVVEKGKVKVHEGDHTFVELDHGKYFGDFSLLDSNFRTASVTALEHTELLRLDQITFFKILGADPDFSRGVLKSIVKRFYDKDYMEAMLARKNAEIQKQSEEIALQRDEIEKKNKNITDSINYAQRIQNAILPTKDLIEKLVPDSFILYLPKDIVSGDFYWLAEKNGRILLSTVDCTGHGVPGAFMSIVGNNILKQAVNEQNLNCPAQILNFLSRSVHETLRQSTCTTDDEVKDGMDLAVAALDLEKMMLYFAAVHNPMYIVRGEEVIQFSTDKHPIGEPFNDEFQTYTLTEFPLEKGDTIYVFSDGYVDQFGGPKRKKFMTRRFRDMIVEVRDMPMDERRDYFEKVFVEWRGETEQYDDICIFCVRV